MLLRKWAIHSRLSSRSHDRCQPPPVSMSTGSPGGHQAAVETHAAWQASQNECFVRPREGLQLHVAFAVRCTSPVVHSLRLRQPSFVPGSDTPRSSRRILSAGSRRVGFDGRKIRCQNLHLHHLQEAAADSAHQMGQYCRFWYAVITRPAGARPPSPSPKTLLQRFQRRAFLLLSFLRGLLGPNPPDPWCCLLSTDGNPCWPSSTRRPPPFSQSPPRLGSHRRPREERALAAMPRLACLSRSVSAGGRASKCKCFCLLFTQQQGRSSVVPGARKACAPSSRCTRTFLWTAPSE